MYGASREFDALLLKASQRLDRILDVLRRARRSDDAVVRLAAVSTFQALTTHLTMMDDAVDDMVSLPTAYAVHGSTPDPDRLIEFMETESIPGFESHWTRPLTPESKFLRLASNAEMIVSDPNRTAEQKYDAIFSELISVPMRQSGFLPDYADPDTSHEEDVAAFMQAVRDGVQRLQKSVKDA